MGEIDVRVRPFDVEAVDDLAELTAPAPIEPGDLVASDIQALVRANRLLELDPAGVAIWMWQTWARELAHDVRTLAAENEQLQQFVRDPQLLENLTAECDRLAAELAHQRQINREETARYEEAMTAARSAKLNCESAQAKLDTLRLELEAEQELLQKENEALAEEHAVMTLQVEHHRKLILSMLPNPPNGPGDSPS